MHRKYVKVKRLRVMMWLEVQSSNSVCLKATDGTEVALPSITDAPSLHELPVVWEQDTELSSSERTDELCSLRRKGGGVQHSFTNILPSTYNGRRQLLLQYNIFSSRNHYSFPYQEGYIQSHLTITAETNKQIDSWCLETENA